jgi:histone H3/H4
MAKKAAKKKAGSKAEALFVKSKVREFIKGKGCNTSSGVLDGDALNGIITSMLDKAVARAQANGRKTVKARDL